MRPRLTNLGWAVAAAAVLVVGGYWVARSELPGSSASMQPSVAELVEQLNSGVVADRRRAVAGLVRLGSEAGEAVGPLMAALADADYLVRSQAAIALGRIGPPAVEPLTAALADPGVSREAAEALGRVGPAAAAAVPQLVRLLRADEAVSLAAAEALGKIGAASVPALLDELRDGPPLGRKRAAESLAWIGRPAAAAVGPLVAALNDRDPAIRSAAARAL